MSMIDTVSIDNARLAQMVSVLGQAVCTWYWGGQHFQDHHKKSLVNLIARSFEKTLGEKKFLVIALLKA